MSRVLETQKRVHVDERQMQTGAVAEEQVACYPQLARLVRETERTYTNNDHQTAQSWRADFASSVQLDDEGRPTWWCVSLSKIAVVISAFIVAPSPLRNTHDAPCGGNIRLSTKPEVHNVLQRRKKRIEPRPGGGHA